MAPYIRGRVTRQAHVSIPEGLVEEEYGRNGFFGRYAHLYRSESPLNWTRIEGDLKPRAYNPNPLAIQVNGSFLENRVSLLENSDVRIGLAKFKKTMDYYYRNADGDEVYFVHAGSGTLETDFGPIKYGKRDYLIVPRGTVHRFIPDAETTLLTIESFSEVSLPDKGMLGQHAFFDPAMVEPPNPADLGEHRAKEYELRIKRCDAFTKVFYDSRPINTIGWKGDLFAWRINTDDIRPIVCERYHLPPSAHSTFVANNFVICTFLPRSLETGDPAAMKVPFYHSNIDFDEVIFYHDGEFFSRAGIGAGFLTFHPQGIHHGPQNSAVERAKNATKTDEIAVMIDTKRPLFQSKAAAAFEIENYHLSWRT